MKYLLVLTLLTSCASRNTCCPPPPQELTLGVVQKEIFQGMGQDEVVMALGSPNIVTRDKEGKETWVYDKIATEVKGSSSSTFFIIFQASKAQMSSSQKTLTVVLKFNDDKILESFSHHSSRF